MKVFMFEKIKGQVPSFGALPQEAWMALGILELVCAVGLIVPAVFHGQPGAHGGGGHGPGDREPRVRLGARQVRRDHLHHHERRARPTDGVPCVRPDGTVSNVLNSGSARELCTERR